MLGKIEGGRRRGQQRMRWLDGISDSMDVSFEQGPGVGDGQGNLVCCSPCGLKESDTMELLNDNGDGLVAKSCPTLVTPWSIAHQAPLSM